jgi:phosphatidylglycerophosphate synthase
VVRGVLNERTMGFWSGYFSSLKPREVEEPIDVWVHRPLAYLVAKACMPLPVSPNAITVLSILAGLLSGALLVWEIPHHLPWSGLCLFLSAVLDCADGQLARMRKTSSVIGRMLDGVADLITTSAVAPLTAFVLWRRYATPWWLGLTLLGLSVAAMVTSSFHTAMYDHYKNVFLRLTGPYQEGEDYEAALARFLEKRGTMPFVLRLSYPIYLFYVKSQRDYVRTFDPFTSSRFALFPPHDPERALIYRSIAGPVMRVWRSVFGFGSLVFGLALFNAVGRPEIYLAVRLVLLNAAFYGYLRPAQRRASKEAFARMGIELPDRRRDEPAWVAT